MPPEPTSLTEVMRLLYNLPPSREEACQRASQPLRAVNALPLKQVFSPDRFDPMPRAKPRTPAA